MPKEITLTNMSAKLLVDFISLHHWAKGYDDTYRAGELLADVLPRFADQVFVDEQKKIQEEGGEPSKQQHVDVPKPPVAKRLTDKGEPNWAAMTFEEASAFRTEIEAHNRNFFRWQRTRLKVIALTDKQLEVCQRVIKFYSPNSEESKKDEKSESRGQGQQIPRIPIDEHTFVLLKELSLNPA